MRVVPRETMTVDAQVRDLVRGCEEMGLRLEEAQARMFSRYLEELLAWNKKVNLVSRRHTEQIAVNHFLDCLSLFVSVDLHQRAALMDVGSGAGLPGIPLKIMREDISLVLVEATQKKALFLKYICGVLGFSETRILSSRAEDLHAEVSLLSCFDMVVSRAVSDLRDLVDLSFPFLRKGGVLVAFKGGDVSGEIAEAMAMLHDRKMEGALLNDIEMVLPISNKRRRLVVFTKL